MTPARQWAIVLVSIGLVAAGIGVGVQTLGSQFSTVTVGSHAPEFRAVTLDVPPVERGLAHYRGRVTVLNVWVTFCAPCRVEMPSFQRLYDAYRHKGLQVVAVSVDAPGAADAIRDFVAEFGLTFDVLHDPEGAIQRDYMTTGVPVTFIIGKDGIIRFKEIGYRQWDTPETMSLIDALLSEQ